MAKLLDPPLGKRCSPTAVHSLACRMPHSIHTQCGPLLDLPLGDDVLPRRCAGFRVYDSVFSRAAMWLSC